jgi:hypothetical protein
MKKLISAAVLLSSVIFFKTAYFIEYKETEVLAQKPPEELVIQKNSGKLLEAHSENWKAKKLPANNLNGNLRTVHFVNESVGWVSDGERIYSTLDGGLSWSALNLRIPAGSKIEKIQCLSENLCWVLSQNRGSGNILDYKTRHYQLSKTNDGGKNWTVQNENKTVVIDNVYFADERNGWLVGTKFAGNPISYTYFALSTKDGGSNWEDISQNISKIVAEEINESPNAINDQLLGIVSSNNGEAKVITARNRILKTSDSGMNWINLVTLKDFYTQVSFDRFGQDENGLLWMSGSTSGEEGTWSVLAAAKSRNNWVGYGLGGVYFADVLNISDNHFLACGYTLKLQKVKGLKDFKQTGVILESLDAGESWRIVYQDAGIEIINSLSITNSNVLWAAGENKTLIKMTSPQH